MKTPPEERKFKPGERLRCARELRGLSISALARAANIDKGQISRFEKGERPEMSVDQLAKIVDALGESIDWIWFGGEVSARSVAFRVPRAQTTHLPPASTEADSGAEHILTEVVARPVSAMPPSEPGAPVATVETVKAPPTKRNKK